MSDAQFNVLFYQLLLITLELFVIGLVIYASAKGLTVEWSKWKEHDEIMNDQARGDQTATIVSKLDEILDELSCE